MHGTESPANAKPRDIVARSAEFADRVIQVSLALPHNVVGWEIGKQLVRAAMSVGANIEEAQAGQSRADFLSKMKIARKECREARYFMFRIVNAKLFSPTRMAALLDEAEQLIKIMTTIIRKSGG